MRNENHIIHMLADKIVKAIDTKTKHLTYDKSFPSVIYGKDGEKYKIVYEDRLRSVPNALPNDLEQGTLVWVKIPCGRLKDMHIYGIRK